MIISNNIYIYYVDILIHKKYSIYIELDIT